MKKIITVEDIWRRFNNKYFAIVLASREARKIARDIREDRLRTDEKPTMLALKKLINGEIKYRTIKRRVKILHDFEVTYESDSGDIR